MCRSESEGSLLPFWRFRLMATAEAAGAAKKSKPVSRKRAKAGARRKKR